MMSFISKPDLVQISFSALTLLVGHQELHPACKNGVMTCWHGCLSGVQMMCIWSSWCHCHPIVSCEIKTRMVYLSGGRLPTFLWKRGC